MNLIKERSFKMIFWIEIVVIYKKNTIKLFKLSLRAREEKKRGIFWKVWS